MIAETDVIVQLLTKC